MNAQIKTLIDIAGSRGAMSEKQKAILFEKAKISGEDIEIIEDLLSEKKISIQPNIPAIDPDEDLVWFIAACDLAMQPPMPEDMRYYSCVALCALDAVFSIRTRYEPVVINLLHRFCAQYRINHLFAPNPHQMPVRDQQLTLSELRRRMMGVTGGALSEILQNRQRTSTRNGILKAEAFMRYLDVMNDYHIDTYQDLNEVVRERPGFEGRLRQIPGQNVSVDYFFMLAGNENAVKVDTHIRRFAEGAIGRDLNDQEIRQLFADAVTFYRRNGYPTMTARHLDHIVWSWQKGQE